MTAGKKPMLLIVASDRAIKEKGVKANEFASKIGTELSLRGGGKPHMAQMGITGTDDFERVKSVVKRLLEGAG